MFGRSAQSEFNKAHGNEGKRQQAFDYEHALDMEDEEDDSNLDNENRIKGGGEGLGSGSYPDDKRNDNIPDIMKVRAPRRSSVIFKGAGKEKPSGLNVNRFSFSGDILNPLKRNNVMSRNKDHIKERAMRNTDNGRQKLACRYTHLPEGSWRRNYLYCCHHMRLLNANQYFNSYIFFCILLAGALVGVQTYDGLDTDLIVIILDYIVLISFTVEIVAKMMAEGMYPYYFFVSKDWKWNVFDFIIVLFSMPFIPFGGGQVALLRLLRMARLVKLFRKIPQLNMILSGLFGGLKSISYIFVLLVMTFYIY